MSFLEGSRGIYRPIRVLFDTPIYSRALQLCWHEGSYKSQTALVVRLLKLQQKNQIPPQVTAEGMVSLVFEKSASTLRERLWEFELEGLDEEDARPLLTLVWSVNVCNKMRDVIHEAKLLRNSQEALPLYFQHPKLLSVAEDYAEILCDRQKEAPSTRLLHPREVVLEVVPRVLQDFWVLPPQPLMNMPSQQLSKMSVGVTKAVLDGVFSDLTTLGHQVIFSHSARDEMIQSILAEIRQLCPLEVLVDKIKTFSAGLLSDIVRVAVGHICEMFKSQSPEDPAHLSSREDPSASSPVRDHFDLSLSEKQHTTTLRVPPTPPAEPALNEKKQATEILNEQEKQEPITELDSTAVPSPPPPPPPPPPPVSICVTQTGEDVSEMPSRVFLTESEHQSLNINAHIKMVFSAMQDGVFKTNSSDFPQHPSFSLKKNKEATHESLKFSADQIQLSLLLLNLR